MVEVNSGMKLVDTDLARGRTTPMTHDTHPQTCCVWKQRFYGRSIKNSNNKNNHALTTTTTTNINRSSAYLVRSVSTPFDTAPCILPVADKVTSAWILAASPPPGPVPLPVPSPSIQFREVPLGTTFFGLRSRRDRLPLLLSNLVPWVVSRPLLSSCAGMRCLAGPAATEASATDGDASTDDAVAFAGGIEPGDLTPLVEENAAPSSPNTRRSDCVAYRRERVRGLRLPRSLAGKRDITLLQAMTSDKGKMEREHLLSDINRYWRVDLPFHHIGLPRNMSGAEQAINVLCVVQLHGVQRNPAASEKYALHACTHKRFPQRCAERRRPASQNQLTAKMLPWRDKTQTSTPAPACQCSERTCAFDLANVTSDTKTAILSSSSRGIGG